MNWSPLLRWYAREGRDLPWRQTHDAYRILVSEIMLQQTQVARVLLFYKAWLKKFPTWHALARASNTEVVHAWAGLGYNRRGLMLRDIARHVTTHGLPSTEEEWRQLKGIGPYTAAAIASFAQGQRTIPIDTNIRRVLGRLLLAKPFPAPADDNRIRRSVGARRASPLHADHFQAMFDLAVAICTKNPDCAVCPMRNQCPMATRFLAGKVRIPKRSIKKAVESKHRNKPHPDRIYRGRILAALRTSTQALTVRKLGPLIDPQFDPKQDLHWIAAMMTRLCTDGLARRIDKNRFSV